MLSLHLAILNSSEKINAKYKPAFCLVALKRIKYSFKIFDPSDNLSCTWIN